MITQSPQPCVSHVKRSELRVPTVALALGILLAVGLFAGLASPTHAQTLTPSSLTFSAVAGGGAPASQTLTLSPPADGKKRYWAILSKPSWISVSPTTGMIQTSSSSVTVSAVTSGMAAGIYSSTIFMEFATSTGAPAGSTTVLVTLNLTSGSSGGGSTGGTSPVIALSPSSLSFSGTEGGANPSAQTVSLTNPGGGTLSTSWSSNASWLVLSASSRSTTTETDSVNVTANTSGLSAGNYSGTVIITGNASNSPQQIPVSLTVSSGATAPPPPPPPTSSGGATTYQASADFSGSQGQRGWYYRDSQGRQMTWNSGESVWQGAEAYNILWNDGGHPGSSGDAVRRWVAPSAGSAQITGTARDGDGGCGSGVTVSIRKGSSTLWQQALTNGNSTGIPFNVTTSVASGDALDFVINRGNDGNNACDSTEFDPAIAFTSTSTSTSGGGSTSTTTTSVLLTWNANSESDLQGYRIYYGTASGSYGTTIDVGKVTSYTVNGLSSGRTYYFSLRAIDTSGNLSGYATETSAVR